MDIAIHPTINASLNLLSFLFLIAGYIAIKNSKRLVHIAFMAGALVTTLIFLISYLIYHYKVGSTPFVGEGVWRVVYYFILITHTVLAPVVLLLALSVVRFAVITKDFDSHKKFAKWLLPIWLYVSFTGVLIYIFLYLLFPVSDG